MYPADYDSDNPNKINPHSFSPSIKAPRPKTQRPTQSRPHPLRHLESQSANSPSNPYVGLNEGFLLRLATIYNYNKMLEMVFGIHPIRHFLLSVTSLDAEIRRITRPLASAAVIMLGDYAWEL